MGTTSAPEWFGQPRGLTVLFLTEMWEKFSFFGMRAILVYYMTSELLLGQQRASFVYGLYTAFVYLTPIFGGMLSDRWLGRRRSVVIGGSIMAAGHFMMAFEPLFYVALATIALGNGLYLPSLPSQIGSLYPQGDPRRVSSYGIYYVGINIGSFLAPLVCGTLGELYGWHWGFGAAGVGMVVGLLIYIAGGKYLPREEPRAVPGQLAGHDEGGLARRFALLVAIAGTVLIFRGAYEQVGNTVALWAEAGVDRRFGAAFSIPMTWFQSLNPMFVILFGPMLAARWTRLAQQGRDQTPLAKMSLGAVGVAAAYFMLALVSISAAETDRATHWLWLSTFLFVLTVGELYILPVGLALFGRLAPRRFTATTIATWFLAAFAGNLFAGALGALWSRVSHPTFFAMLGFVALLAAALLLLLRQALRQLETDAARELGLSTVPATLRRESV